VGHDRTHNRSHTSEELAQLNDWPRLEHPRVFDTILEAVPVTADSQEAKNNSVGKSGKRKRRLTICYWKPAILLFHLELVGQT
jgi:hypothetical protein